MSAAVLRVRERRRAALADTRAQVTTGRIAVTGQEPDRITGTNPTGSLLSAPPRAAPRARRASDRRQRRRWVNRVGQHRRAVQREAVKPRSSRHHRFTFESPWALSPMIGIESARVARIWSGGRIRRREDQGTPRLFLARELAKRRLGRPGLSIVAFYEFLDDNFAPPDVALVEAAQQRPRTP